MKLNHLNLTVVDAHETAQFLQKHFGLTPHEGATNSAAFAVLRDENGMVLTLIRAKRGTTPSYPDTFHIGFIQDSESKVDEIHARLLEDGIEAPLPARLHGSYTFYFTAPGGFTIEVLG